MSSLPPSSTPPSPLPEEAAILNTANLFLSSIKSKDRALMTSLILPTGSATLIRRNKPVHLTLAEVVDRIPVDSVSDMDEQIYNCTVRVDGELGVAWTPYVFYIDGRVNHTGTNIFSMWKTEGKWVITGVADIAREVEPGNRDPVAEG